MTAEGARRPASVSLLLRVWQEPREIVGLSAAARATIEIPGSDIRRAARSISDLHVQLDRLFAELGVITAGER